MKTANKKTILIIEDNHDLRVCLRQHLESDGYKVLSATNGKDALEILETGFIPGVIVVDLKMPMMSGEEFLSWKKKKATLNDIRTVVISGQYPTDPGFDNVAQYIPKPIDWDAFSVAVHG